MTNFLQLNLQQPDKKPDDANLPRPEGVQAQPVVSEKKLSRIANRAAHKAAGHFGRSGSGIFSK